jgi:membrane-bound ClpP family serine protease
LDREKVNQLQSRLEEADTGPVIVEIDSTSGNLDAVFDLVKSLWTKKTSEGWQVIVYADDNVLGPAALLPFLADELYVSPFVSWGDMLLSTESEVPVHVLKSRLRSLVVEGTGDAALLQLMAEGMVDSELVIVDEGGWRAKRDGEEGVLTIVKAAGDPLVLGQAQLSSLGLVQGVEALSRFRQRFEVTASAHSSSEVDAQGSLRVRPEALIESLKEHLPFDMEGQNRVGHIRIDDRQQGITQATWIYVKSALDYYKEQRPAFILLELNTPGGEVFSAQKISDALKEMDTQYDIPVVAYIDNWAISAGAMLAYSCRYIAIVKDAAMGAAAPVFAGQGGEMTMAPEKINSALRTDFANRAGFFERNGDLAEAMVDMDIIIVRRHGKLLKLDNEEQIRSEGVDKDEIISAKGKLLTLSADQMMDLGVADLRLEPKKLAPISIDEAEKGQWPAEKELLFHAPYFEDIPNAYVDSYQPDWKVRFLAIIASPAVASFLFLGMMLGFYVEINTPGFGFPGSVGLVCLSLILMSSFSLDIVNWLEVVFLIAGAVLLAVELFVIPGFGVAGIAGIVLFVVGLFAVMLPGLESVSYDVDTQTVNAAGEVFLERLAWLCGALVTGTISMFFLGKYVMPSLGAFSRLVLEDPVPAGEARLLQEQTERLPDVGTVGVAESPLRPAGRASFGDESFEVLSDGVYIPAGDAVQVTRIEGNRVFVDLKSEQ